jgi:hypothetical protein
MNPSYLPNLTRMDVRMSDLDEQSLKSLGALPELRHLTLTTWSTVTINVNDGFFRKLRPLMLYESAVLFVLNEDLSASFTLWSNGDDVVPFGSQKDIVRAPAIMPNLQVLRFSVVVKDLARNCDKFGMECYSMAGMFRCLW